MRVLPCWPPAPKSITSPSINRSSRVPRLLLAELGNDVGTYYDDTVIARSFSGGGTRAAAFSYGVLTALDQTPMPNRPTSLLDRVDFVTGVSGGSVLAAYYD